MAKRQCHLIRTDGALGWSNVRDGELAAVERIEK